MQIFLLRHADAELTDSGQSDHDRPLSNKGLIEAQKVSQQLQLFSYKISTVLCSSAQRTRQTLSKLALDKATCTFEETLYWGSGHDYYRLLQLKACSGLLIIGHNPSISALIHHLGCAPYPDFSLPTAGLVAFHCTQSLENAHIDHFFSP